MPVSASWAAGLQPGLAQIFLLLPDDVEPLSRQARLVMTQDGFYGWLTFAGADSRLSTSSSPHPLYVYKESKQMVSMHKNGILQEQVVSLVRDRRGYLTRRSWKGELRWVFEIGNEPAIIQMAPQTVNNATPVYRPSAEKDSRARNPAPQTSQVTRTVAPSTKTTSSQLPQIAQASVSTSSRDIRPPDDRHYIQRCDLYRIKTDEYGRWCWVPDAQQPLDVKKLSWYNKVGNLVNMNTSNISAEYVGIKTNDGQAYIDRHGSGAEAQYIFGIEKKMTPPPKTPKTGQSAPKRKKPKSSSSGFLSKWIG